MAEKRKLSTRDRREPAAKRRVSEATPQPQGPPKKKGSTPAVPTPPPQPSLHAQEPLPIKIKDGEALPILPAPQPETLSDKEYQSIAESAVLLASLERSKKKWLSDGILVRYWTKPKKTKREQIEGKNPPKESMSKIGPCNIVVGPHLFDAMLYTVKDPNAPPPLQYTPPQRPMVHYGPPNNFQQYHPYPQPTPPNARQSHPPPPVPQYSPAPGPQPGYQPGNHPPHPAQGRPPQQHPPPQQSAQRPSPSQNQPPQAQPPKPSPDPVIQMLATRAASDPDLKALMRVVASSKASQEQLRAFQAHIDELNAIIRAREQQQQRQQQASSPAQSTPQTKQQQQPPPPPPQTPSQKPTEQSQSSSASSQQSQKEGQKTPQSQPQPKSTPQSLPRVEVHVPKPSASTNNPPPQTPQQNPSQKSTPKGTNATPQIKQEPGAAAPTPTPAASSDTKPPTPSTPSVPAGQPSTPGPPMNSKQPSPAVRPMPPPQQPVGPRPGPPYPPYQQAPYQGHPPPIQSRHPQYGPPAQYYRQAPPPPPPRLNYKSVVFEFTSPLTPYGSSTSGHAGSGDRYLFPENTILEWLPGGTTVLASFLVIKKVDPNTPFPIETASDTANPRTKKAASKSKKGKAQDKTEAEEKEKDDKEKSKDNAQPTPGPAESKAPTEDGKPGEGDKSSQPAATPGKDDSGKQPEKDKPDDAKKDSNLKEYWQPVTFRIYSANPKVLEPLTRVVKPQDEVRKYMNEVMDRAERAPDGFLAYRLPREKDGDDHEEDNKKSENTTPAAIGGRTRPSRAKEVEVEEDSGVEIVEEEEELKDYYGPPTGMAPMGV